MRPTCPSRSVGLGRRAPVRPPIIGLLRSRCRLTALRRKRLKSLTGINGGAEKSLRPQRPSAPPFRGFFRRLVPRHLQNPLRFSAFGRFDLRSFFPLRFAGAAAQLLARPAPSLRLLLRRCASLRDRSVSCASAVPSAPSPNPASALSSAWRPSATLPGAGPTPPLRRIVLARSNSSTTAGRRPILLPELRCVRLCTTRLCITAICTVRPFRSASKTRP